MTIIKIGQHIQESIDTKQKLLEDVAAMSTILAATEALVAAYKRGNKTILAGNGGSAADAQHIAGEFVSRFYFDRPGLASLALTTDTSIITAIGNDYGYKRLFSRQVQANGVEGDVFFGISTSGNSENIVEALQEARKKKITTIGLTGSTGGKMNEFCDFLICVPSNETPRIQESHILIGHILCALVEEALFDEGTGLWKQ